MAVAYDNVATDTVFAGTSFTTGSFTIDTSSIGNRVATVGLHHVDGPATSITVTVGGESGSELADFTNVERILVYGVIAPAQGSQTGSAAWTTNVSGVMGVMTFTGAHQSTAFNNLGSDNNASAGPISVVVTSNSGDLTFSHVVTTGALSTTNGTETYSVVQNTRGQGDYGDGTGDNTHEWDAGWTRKYMVAANIIQVSVITGQAFRLRAIEKYFMPIFDNITDKIIKVGQYIRGMIKGKKRLIGGQIAGSLP